MRANLDQLHRSICQVRYTRQIAKLADALMYALNIQQGNALVPFLAPLHASDNREAVAYWLSREMESPDVTLSRHCIEILLPRLEKRLQAIEEDAR